MARLAERYPDDTEAAIFYALALNEAVDLNDKTYAKQFKAAAILQIAESIASQKDRAMLLRMAEIWHRMAEEKEQAKQETERPP
jgi:hypothetical protein